MQKLFIILAYFEITAVHFFSFEEHVPPLLALLMHQSIVQ